ncbi:hypothetical protein Tco_1051160, partial [Tanacetum coccineum]
MFVCSTIPQVLFSFSSFSSTSPPFFFLNYCSSFLPSHFSQERNDDEYESLRFLRMNKNKKRKRKIMSLIKSPKEKEEEVGDISVVSSEDMDFYSLSESEYEEDSNQQINNRHRGKEEDVEIIKWALAQSPFVTKVGQHQKSPLNGGASIYLRDTG